MTILYINALKMVVLCVCCFIIENELCANELSTEQEQTVMHKYTNKLIDEKSPYLQQHAHNPVDWYPWSDEAFEKAAKENKPIFLSIGYSTCHWCHVMEHESFEDEEVAELLNKGFVSIKVDREERPDIDHIYMTVCQMMTGSGGWPMTIVMSPDKKPFFAATYIPKNARYRRPGMMQILPSLVDAWENQRDEVDKITTQIIAALDKQSGGKPGEVDLDESLQKAYKEFSSRFDKEYGGFSLKPKFPSAHNFMFLMRHWQRTGEKHALDMVTKTLDEMRSGGIYDHIGFGFHRYSTDRVWKLPHFEKMLYDQAMALFAYSEAYQITGNDLYRQTVGEIATYLKRDMTDPKGAFFSAEDADSEGEEGTFYIWSDTELKELLTNYEYNLFTTTFNIEKGGNFRDESTGKQVEENIPHQKGALQQPPEFEAIREKLFIYREKRIHPFKDTKVLTDWNGLTIAALARASRLCNTPEFADMAVKAADFILSDMVDDKGRLLHRYKDGSAEISATIDDYAFLVYGLIELYEVTFNVDYLKQAVRFNKDMITYFHDDVNGGFFMTADDAEELISRPKESYDGAIPSGNSVALYNLIKLSRITGDTALDDYADKLINAFAVAIDRMPSGQSQMLVAIDYAVGSSYEITIVGNSDEPDTKAMIDAVNSVYLPNKVVLLKPDDSQAITGIASYVDAQNKVDGKSTVFICKNYACEQPLTDPAQVKEKLLHYSRPLP